MSQLVQTLLNSTDPCIRYRTAIEVCGLSAASPAAIEMREAIRTSDRAKRILSIHRNSSASIGVYAKFTGAHWALADLADIRHPVGDSSLLPMRDRVYDYWLDSDRTRERIVEREAARYKSQPGVPIIEGRARRCASQEGNSLYASIALGIADERAARLAANLSRWQWPDGGWNCDRRADAATSSFHESLLSLRGLSWYVKCSSSDRFSKTSTDKAAMAIERAAEYFLERRLYKRKRDGSVIHDSFLKLRYPHYWHYDILIGLKVMAEAGYIHDPRCGEALDIIESKQLPGGGWRAERKHSKLVDTPTTGGSMVEWGAVSRGKVMNEFVTVEALSVLCTAGRFSSGIDGDSIPIYRCSDEQ